ncbi:hypothetical protein [Phenylobacterium sp.]|uniref:hypothetical protein n=1 Tax=Phenylobacterium sp. TaxID=1871053 RepID=UPI0035AEF732
MLQRFDIRQEAGGWTVYDRWTGQAVVFRGVAQVRMRLDDAYDMADLLNWRVARGAREIYQ